MEDEFHLLFECSRYHHIRSKYENSLFADFGGVSRAARVMSDPGKVSAFLNQEPSKVASFVWKCMEYIQEV